MDDRDRKYSLYALSEASKVSARSIRSYISQGLIPGPVGQGSAAHYTELHRKRLNVIRKLRNHNLPLEEIRRYLMMAGEEEDIQIVPVGLMPSTMRERIMRIPSEELYDEADEVSHFCMEEPIDKLESPLSEQPRLSSRRARMEYLSERIDCSRNDSPSESPLQQLVSALNRLVGLDPSARLREPSSRGSACHMVEVTPDISLLIKGEYPPHEAVLFQRLADALREALTRGIDSMQLEDDE